MEDFLKNIKCDLAKMSNEHAIITLSRKDVIGKFDNGGVDEFFIK